MSSSGRTTLLAQLRTVLDLTNIEIQIAETRVAQARTEAVRRELTQNAANGRDRAEAIDAAIRQLGGFPDVIGPFLGRATAAIKALAEQARPFDEALLGDLALEDQLLDRARYIKALAVAADQPGIEDLASRLIAAHSATVDWLTTVLAEDALGGPAALRRTPFQAATGTTVKLVNLPAAWSARGFDRAAEALRSTSRSSTNFSVDGPTPVAWRRKRFPHRGTLRFRPRRKLLATKGPARLPMHCIQHAPLRVFLIPLSCPSPVSMSSTSARRWLR
jgi:hypothetical protein